MQGARTRHGSRRYKGESRKQKIAYCASARSGYSGASIISCVTSYFLLHASDFVRRFPDRGQGMTWKGGATPHSLPTLCTIRARKITTVVTVAPKHTCDIKLISAKIAQRIKITDRSNNFRTLAYQCTAEQSTRRLNWRRY
jgi:hypothetical protein